MPALHTATAGRALCASHGPPPGRRAGRKGGGKKEGKKEGKREGGHSWLPALPGRAGGGGGGRPGVLGGRPRRLLPPVLDLGALVPSGHLSCLSPPPLPERQPSSGFLGRRRPGLLALQGPRHGRAPAACLCAASLPCCPPARTTTHFNSITHRPPRWAGNPRIEMSLWEPVPLPGHGRAVHRPSTSACRGRTSMPTHPGTHRSWEFRPRGSRSQAWRDHSKRLPAVCPAALLGDHMVTGCPAHSASARWCSRAHLRNKRCVLLWRAEPWPPRICPPRPQNAILFAISILAAGIKVRISRPDCPAFQRL